MITLLKKLINTPSFDGVDKRAISTLITEELAKFPNIHIANLRSSGLTNLVATTGTGPSHIWSLCHTDTVKPVPGWATNPTEPVEKGGKIFGLGASDMKGPLAVNIKLIQWASQQKLPFTFSLCITQDEELGGKNGLPILLKKLPQPKFVIVNESTPDQKISLMEPGVVAVEISWLGKSTHCSQGKLSQNSIFKAAKLISRVGQAFPAPEFIINPTLISAGTSQNVTPAQTQLVLDVRFFPPHDSSQIVHKLHHFARNASIKVLVKGEARESLDDVFFQTLKKTFLQNGIKSHLTSKIMGSTDARFLHGTSINSAVFGNDSNHGNRHSSNEFVIISELERLLEIDKSFISNLAH